MIRPRIKAGNSKKLYSVTALRQETNLARGRYGEGMTLPEFKIWMITASQDSLNLETTATELCSLANLNGYGVRKYVMVQEFLTALLKREVHFLTQDLEKGTFRFTGFPLLAEASYEEGGKAAIQINPKLAPYIHNLKRRFTSINLKELLSVSSYYQARLYMLVCSCKALQFMGARTFSIPDLAAALGIPFKQGEERFVIRQIRECQKALQKTTSLSFFLTVLKTGRKISAVRFDFPKPLAKNSVL